MIFIIIFINLYVNNFTRLTELKFLIWKNEESLSRFQRNIVSIYV